MCRLFSKTSTFSGKQYNFDQVNEIYISQGSAVTFFRCDGQKNFKITDVKFRQDFVHQTLLLSALLLKTIRMWANAQPDGRPAEHRWRPLFNAAKFG